MICPGLCPNLGRIWPDSPNAIKNMITDRLQAHLSNKRNIFRRFDMVSFAKFKHPRTLADPSNALHEADCVEPWSPVSAIIMMDQKRLRSEAPAEVSTFLRVIKNLKGICATPAKGCMNQTTSSGSFTLKAKHHGLEVMQADVQESRVCSISCT